jgi:hypothetical protein
MKALKRLLKLTAIALGCVLLILLGFAISLAIAPINGRLVANACYIEGYETVFCQKGESEDLILYRVLGVKDGYTVQIQHEIKKIKAVERKL